MVPQVTLFQDFSTTSAFDATYEIGKSYNLTLGVWARSSVNPIAPGSTLAISLYYRDNLNNKVPINTTTISYSTSTFTPGAPNPNLIDFNLNIPTVQAGDAWAGKNIGIQLESTIPIEMTSFGNWDFDNLRLTAVPEPSALALLGMGVGGLILARTRRKG
jgi:hypothetical protein